MKKILAILLALTLVFSLAACNDGNSDTNGSSGGTSTEQGGSGNGSGGTQGGSGTQGGGSGTQGGEGGSGTQGGGTQGGGSGTQGTTPGGDVSGGEGGQGGNQGTTPGGEGGQGGSQGGEGGNQGTTPGGEGGQGGSEGGEGGGEGSGSQGGEGGNQGTTPGGEGGQGGGEGGDKEPDPSLAGKALSIVKNFLAKKLDVWEYVPSALKPENMVSDNVPTDFNTDFVPVNTIGKKAIGKQLNVVYDIFGYVETISGYLDTVIAAQDLIIDAYQLFINDNPDNYAHFEKQMAHFDLKIDLTATQNVLLVRLTTAAIEIYYNDATKASTVRVQLSDGNVLKYETSEGHLKAALSIMNVAKWQVEFDENDEGGVDGKLYEFYGIAGKYIKTVADYHMDENYTYIIADKRESDDLLIEGYLEAYSSVTGEYLGADVKETVKLIDYDTLWIPLSDVSGITSVKKTDEKNKLNADTIYINGKSEPIKTTGIASRHFDIEFKEVWYYQTDADGKLEKVKTEIPMLFVQTKNYDDLAKDFNDENQVTITIQHGEVHADIQEAYGQYVEAYAADKKLVTVDEIDTFIGTKNAFFN